MSCQCDAELHSREDENSVSYVVSTTKSHPIIVAGAIDIASQEQKDTMNTRKPYMGIHLHLDKRTAEVTLAETMKLYPELTDVQIFTHGPQNHRATKAYDHFAPIAAKYNVRIWTHGSYLCVPWKNTHLSMHTLDNIKASARLGSHCTVVHIPFSKPDDVVSGLATVITHMRSLGLTDTKLMLETSATVADTNCSYENSEKLNRLTAAIIKAGYQDCVRICVDTAHIFAGRAKISSHEDAVSWWHDLDTRLLGMIHLNGSSNDPDLVKGDRHEVPMSPQDLIWGPKSVISGEHTYASRGCSVFVAHARRLEIPIILEVSGRHSPAEIRKFITATAP